MINFKVGERVMNGTNERDGGTVLEVKPGCDANDHVIVQWDRGETAGCGADCLNSLDRGAWQIKPTTVQNILDVHAQFGRLDRESVKTSLGANWPAHWDSIGPDEGIFAAPCARCNDSGEIGVRNDFRASYVGPGPVPDDARGVVSAKCDECKSTVSI